MQNVNAFYIYRKKGKHEKILNAIHSTSSSFCDLIENFNYNEKKFQRTNIWLIFWNLYYGHP
jgi:hypothetical protein